MTSVRFDVTVDFDASPRAVWDELVDWEGHGDWIPATRVEVDGDDPTAVGTTFTGWTGVGPLALEDRMRVQACDWDEEADAGRCEVEKLGPVLTGRAGFTVAPAPSGSQVVWFEDVEVRYLPRLLGPVAARFGALGFRGGMRRLARRLR
jgi:carbon monoxide dehydrogenase subunit G